MVDQATIISAWTELPLDPEHIIIPNCTFTLGMGTFLCHPQHLVTFNLLLIVFVLS